MNDLQFKKFGLKRLPVELNGIIKGAAKNTVLYSNKDCSMNSFIEFKSQISIEKLEYSACQHISDF